MNQYTRTERLIGQDSMERLWKSRVAVFGIGGVGGNAVEALARSGVGNIDIIDNDFVSLTNINRQIIATLKNYGQAKVDAAEQRIHDINPDIKVTKYQVLYLPDKKNLFPFEKWDYIIDAIDNLTAKIDIIVTAEKLHIPVISAMGCGNRVDPTKLTITDIYKTQGDPMARRMRYELKKRNIRSLKVVYSTETPLEPSEVVTSAFGKTSPGSTAFVPPMAGTILAYQACMDIAGFNPEKAIKEQLQKKMKKKQSNHKEKII
jgi:tRNA A37 threonylcarbamoyladenosine dehydratase